MRVKHPISKLFGMQEKVEQASENEQESVCELPVVDIVPNRFQPRTVFQDEKLDELSQTIASHGMIQPIVVRQVEGKYEIIAGERRWRAACKLGWKMIPAIIKDYDDTETASVALIENLQREELTSIEEAMAYARLLDLHGLTQEGLAQQLGKGQSTIANKLRLLKLPASVQEALLEKKISERHARALIALKDAEKQEKLLKEMIDKGLNVKQTEARVEKILAEKKSKREKKPKRRSYSKDVRLAVNTIRQSVDMVVESGLSIDTEEREHDGYYEFTIRIPKK